MILYPKTTTSEKYYSPLSPGPPLGQIDQFSYIVISKTNKLEFTAWLHGSRDSIALEPRILRVKEFRLVLVPFMEKWPYLGNSQSVF